MWRRAVSICICWFCAPSRAWSICSASRAIVARSSPSSCCRRAMWSRSSRSTVPMPLEPIAAISARSDSRTRGQVRARERELVGARAQRRLDLVARLVRGARGFDVALELAHVAARGVDLRRALLRGGLGRGQLLGEPRRHRDRKGGARGLRERGDRRLRILAGRQLGQLRVARVEHRVETRGEALAARALRGLVMLALQSRADEVARGLALGGRRLERERGVVAHARERTGRIGEQRIVGDRRARQPARGRARRRPGARTTARATSRARTGRGGRATRRPPSAGAPSARRTARSPPRRTRRARTAAAGTGAGP